MQRPFILRGGTVVDGSGAPARTADVAVLDGRIVDPGTLAREDATVVDVSGLAVSPGFIDVHTHSDATSLLAAGTADAASNLVVAAARQGVTTEIAGNCGYSMFPGCDNPAFAPALTEFSATIFGPGAVPGDFGAYERALTATGRVNNLASLLGHSTLRAAVLGFENREATPTEIDRMTSLLDSALADGAVGWSSGLIYPPGTYANTEELVSLGRVSAARGVPYVTHMRDEMSQVEAALEEAFLIAKLSGTPLHISHHKTAGTKSIGKTVRTLAMMDQARADGLDVTCDVYPYTAGSTQLHAMLPPWLAEGGIGELLARLQSPAVRDRIRHDIQHGVPGWENTVGNGGWHRIDIATAPGHPAAEGIAVADLAAQAQVDPIDYVADLLIAEEGRVTIISRSMDEADMQRVLAHPGTMVGSDGVPKDGKPHPRWAGTFARVLGRYVRDLNVLTLEAAVHRMTLLPARRFGLTGRGSLACGQIADITVFDPATIADRATFADPLLTPQGIERVFVAGHEVLRDQTLSPLRPGVLVRRRQNSS